jgi:hypothetical protein
MCDQSVNRVMATIGKEGGDITSPLLIIIGGKLNQE